jgi:hypothetical protein
MKPSRYIFLISHVVQLWAVLASGVCLGQSNDSLEQRVNRGDPEAFLQAGNEGRKDLIPILENFANMSTDPLDGDRIKARMALAKLGVKKYLADFVADWTSTNSPTFKFYKENSEGLRDADTEAELATKFKTMHRLIYIGDKSTVKFIAADLYNTSKPDRHRLSDNLLESRTPIAWLAAKALSHMNLENAPRPGPEPDPEWLNYIEAWKMWWEQNKDKYP